MKIVNEIKDCERFDTGLLFSSTARVIKRFHCRLDKLTNDGNRLHNYVVLVAPSVISLEKEILIPLLTLQVSLGRATC